MSVVTLTDRSTGTVGLGEALGGDVACATELAEIDLEGRRTARPVWRVLGAEAAPSVKVNATIATEDPARAAAAAATAHEQGFTMLKVKVGLDDDETRLKAVRDAAGPEMQIRIDANGAWGVEEAIAALRALEPIGIECCEEPVSGIEDVARVAAAVDVPISLDESSTDPAAFDSRLCDAVCLKLARLGGVRATLQAAARARSVGYEVYLASMLDGAIGIAAGLHAAAVIKPDRPCGLATLALFAEHPDPFPPHEGHMTPPAGPGLGEGLFDWYSPG